MKKIISYVVSAIFLLLLWQVFAVYIHSEFILPSPKQVFLQIINLMQTRTFWLAFFFTFLRVILAFLISIFCGIILGLLSSLSEYIKFFIELPMSIIRSTPVIAIILFIIFWCKSDFVPIFVAVLLCFPIITTAVLKGFESCDKKRIFMAQSYNLGKWKIFRYIKLPEIVPYFLQSLDSCFGLAWKVVAAGEVLSLPKYALGTVMNKAQIHLEINTMMSVTIVLILVSFLLQKIIELIVKKFNIICFIHNKVI